jgi:protocatechuate 3,4-dioxygenase beta subunit
MIERTNEKRRRLVIGAAGLMIAAPLNAASRLRQPTPKQAAGPFYPVELPLDDDNDLTQVLGQSGQANGRITDLSGRILDINGRPLPQVRIEIWQCDANGRYRHPRDDSSRPVDESFQGHGHATTSDEGGYRFRTIRPIPYPGRTPHIHVAVFPAGEPPFVTQLYVRGEPRNSQDFLFNRVPVERRHLVMADFVPARADDTELSAQFDIVLGGVDGTPNAV